MSIIIGLFYLSFINAFFVYNLKKSFGTCIPLAIMVSVLLMYTAGFLNHVSYGFCAGFILGALVLYQIIKTFNKNKEILKDFIKNYFSSGFVVFVIIFVLLSFIQRFRVFTWWDEFMHWGVMSYETLTTDKFYAINEKSILQIHKDYPPFLSLLTTLFCYFNIGIYTEATCYRAVTIFCFSMFMPLIEVINKEKKSIIKTLVATISVFLVFFAIGEPRPNYIVDNVPGILDSIYADWPMGLMAALSLYLIYKEEDYKSNFYLFLAIVFSSLLLIKQMGVPLVLLSCFYLIVKLFFADRFKESYKILYSVMPSVILLGGWKTLVKTLNLRKQFELSQLNVFDFFKIIKGTAGEAWQHESYVNFIDAIFNRYLTLHPFKLSYSSLIVIICVLILVFIHFDKKKNKESFVLIFIYLFGAIGYGLAMLLLYMFSFGPNEGPIIASYDRYMLTYVLIGITLLMFVMFECINGYKNKCSVIIPILILVLFVYPEKALDLNPNNYEHDYRSNYLSLFENIRKAEPDSDILIIQSYHVSDRDEYITKYYMLLEDYDCDYITLSDKELETMDIENLTLEEFKDRLKNYDYMFNYLPNGYFINNFWYKIEDYDLYDKCLYKVNLTDGEVSLEYIY